VVEDLARRTTGGALAVGRRAWYGVKTRAMDATGAWTRGHPERSFPLMDAVSQVGAPSAPLTAEWHATARRLSPLIARG